MSSPERVFFAAYDAGGANATVPVIAELAHRGIVLKGFVAGPARKIFTEGRISYYDADLFSDREFNSAFDDFRPELLLVGTSTGWTIEKKCIVRARTRRIPSIAVLDFWSNYSPRFSKDKKDFAYLPTVVCVMDERARDEMIIEGFAPECIAVTGNPHFEHFAAKIVRTNEDVREVLFISQPLSEMRVFTDYGFDEFDAIKDITEIVQSVPGLRLRIRLHPKEDAHKYDEYLGQHIQIAEALTLEEAISHAGLIVGMFSSVLIQAAVAGKRVISYEPGLIGEDPLATNGLGLTQKVAIKADLEDALRTYVAGDYAPSALNVDKLWPRGATQRIVRMIETLASRRL